MTIHFRLVSAFSTLLSATLALAVNSASAAARTETATSLATTRLSEKSKQHSYTRLAQARPQAPTAESSSPQLLGQYGDWGAYAANPNGRKVCFALSKPVKAETDPPNRPRDEPYLFISSRPDEKVKDEVSVIFGYAFKPSAEASLEVGGANFSLYTQSDGGWIKNAAEEPRLVDSLRRGNDATVKGVSARGATTTDVYSLKGVTQALERVAQECR